MITITDAAGRTLTIDDEKLTCAEAQAQIDDWHEEHVRVAEFTTAIVPLATPVVRGCSSARWEGPPPKRRGRR